jgi:hypothetical protein
MESRRRKRTEEPPVEERADDLVRGEPKDGDLQDEDLEERERAHDDDDDDSLGRPVRIDS